MYIYIYIYIYTHMCVCTYMYKCVCVCACMCTCIYVYTHTCTHVFREEYAVQTVADLIFDSTQNLKKNTATCSNSLNPYETVMVSEIDILLGLPSQHRAAKWCLDGAKSGLRDIRVSCFRECSVWGVQGKGLVFWSRVLNLQGTALLSDCSISK